MSPDRHPRLVFPRLKGLLTGVACALVATISCGREPTGPGGGAMPIAGLSWLAQFPDGVPALQTAGSGGVLFSKVHVVMRLPSGVMALDTLVDFPVDGDLQLTLSVSLPATAPDTGQTLSLRLDYQNDAGETVFTGGPVKVTAVPVKDGSGPPPPSPVTIPLVYTGTGSKAKSVVIAPLTHQLGEGDSLVYTAQAMDSAGAVIPNTPVVFSVADTTLLSIDAVTGHAKARDKRGATTVTAKLLTGPSASATLTVLPVPGAITKALGDGQSGIIKQALANPLIVRVLGRDGLPMSGVTVNFSASSGGSVTPSAVTDTTGLASAIWTLGDTIGLQIVTVSAGTSVTTTFSSIASTGVPKSILKVSGDGQTGIISTALPQPLGVKVVDQYGNGVPGVPVNWSVTSGGGSVLRPGINTNAQGFAYDTLTLGPVVGLNTVVAENLAIDSIPVTFSATGLSAAANIVWKGTASSAWTDPLNWFPQTVPTASDSVLVQPVGIQPVLSANTAVHRLTIEPVATLDIGTYVLTVGGSLDAGTTINGNGSVVLAGKTGTLAGIVNSPVSISDTSAYTLSGRTWAYRGFVVAGTFDAGGHTLETSALTTSGGTGVLKMTHATDSVIVIGDASFAGGAATTLTAGVLAVGGNLSQSANPHAFAATASHTTVLGGPASQTITFANPGTGAFLSHFGTLKIDNVSGNGVTFATDAYADGQLVMTGATTHLLLSSNMALTTMGANVSKATFNNLRWVITDGAAISGSMSGVTFQAMTPAASYFTMSRVGDATPYPVFTNWSFSPVPTINVGQYMDLIDVANDANPLTVTMTGTNPLLTDGFVRLNSGAQLAVLNGWGNTATWTGAVSSDWFDPSNWSPAIVPTAATDVHVPASTPFAPATAAGGGFTINNLTLDPNATLQVQGGTGGRYFIQGNLAIGAGGNLKMQGFVDDGVDWVQLFGDVVTDTASGTGITGCSSGYGVLEAQGTTSRKITGRFCDLYLVTDFTAVGPVIVDGQLFINGTFTPNGNVVTATDGLNVYGALAMTNAADSVTVNASAYFYGSVPSTLTNGKLVVRGDFYEGGQVPTFPATAAHTTVLAGTGPQTVYFAYPGTGPSNSHFGTLQVANVSDTVHLSNNVYVDGQLVATGAGAHIFYGNGYTLTSMGANVTNVTFDYLPWKVVDGAAISGSMSGVKFLDNCCSIQFQLVRSDDGSTYPTFASWDFGGLDGGLFMDVTGLGTTPLTLNMSNTMVNSQVSSGFYGPNSQTFSVEVNLVNALIVGWTNLTP